MFLKNSKSRLLSPYSPQAKRETIPSIMAQDVSVLGNIVSDGVLDFDGTIDGNIRCKALTVRGRASIKGEVIADTIHVYGKINGLVRARSVHLYATARIEGIIMHENLTIEDGAFIDGKLKRTDKISDGSSDSTLIYNEPDSSVNVLENLRLISA
ncbi:MAG: polymer-forming cytoskeletal protein [Rickettsiales bacterium]|nr:polymer-forming cytoskeletal protein [Rickettsiales bacterium]